MVIYHDTYDLMFTWGGDPYLHPLTCSGWVFRVGGKLDDVIRISNTTYYIVEA